MLTTLANVFRSVFLGSSSYNDSRKRVDDAIRAFTSAMTKLGVDLGMQTLNKTSEILKKVKKTNSMLFGIFRSLHFLIL